jgi:protein-L-isoaspartate(D-aspartate) O-methyltransferase
MSDFANLRLKMVDGQVRPSDVTDIRILDAMLEVPRESFVPENQRAMAYLDLDLDISAGAAAKRWLIKPVVIGKMLQAADIKATDKVLVAGSATGYVAAVVAKFAGEVVEGSPVEGDQAHAPYDVIVLDGATEIVPNRLYAQLKEGGRLVGVFATTKPPRAMIVTHTHGDFGNRALFDAVAPVLQGLERLPAFVF